MRFLNENRFFQSIVLVVATTLMAALNGCQSTEKEPKTFSGEFTWNGKSLTIDTGRFTVVWRDGALERFRLNGENPVEFTGKPTMPPTVLPNGLGSFHGDAEAARLQHRAIGGGQSKRKDAPFPAQHPVDEHSNARYDAIPCGGRLTYGGLAGDPTATLIQELTIDSETGDLIVRQSGSSANPGVFGIAFSLLNLRSDLSFALPYFGGQRFGPERGEGLRGYAWPSFWSAGFVVGETPEGDGSFIVFADDPKLGPKYLKTLNDGAAQGLSFEACAQAPYEDRKSVEIPTWRVNAYRGNWVPAAKRYRRWLADAYGLKPLDQRPPKWFHDVALIWPGGPGIEAMRRMSENIDPKHVLCVNYGWAKGFNKNCPLYQTKYGNLAQTLTEAHALGYHYGVYVAEKLVDRHAHPHLFKKYKLRQIFDALSQKPALLDAVRDVDYQKVAEKQEGGFLAAVHAGGDDWIEFYSNLLVDFHEKYGIDCFYEDVAGSNIGSCGLIDGRGLHEGTVACERAIRRKLPDVAAIGEHWNEVCVAAGMNLCSGNYAAWFSPKHHQSLARNAHPVQGCALGGFSNFYNYKTPIRETDKFHTDYHFIEVTGMMPVWTTQPDDVTSEAGVVLARAKLFAEGFRPYYPDDWEKGVAAYMRNSHGELIKYTRKGESSFCHRFTDGRKTLVYARIKGVASYSSDTPIHIDGWPAYGGFSPIGLNPAQWYCVFPGKPARNSFPTLTSIPTGAHVAATREGPNYRLVRLGGHGGEVTWEPESGVSIDGGDVERRSKTTVASNSTLLFISKTPPPPPLEKALPLGSWSLSVIANGHVVKPGQWRKKPRDWSFGGERFRGYTVAPPRGGSGSEISIESLVTIPDAPKVALSFQIGRFGGSGDGVGVVVRVDGEEIWRRISPTTPRSWRPATVALAKFAGKTVVLSLAVDAGPSGFNLSCDETIWGDVKFVDKGKDRDKEGRR